MLKKTSIFIIIILLIIIGLIIGFFIFKNKKQEKKQEIIGIEEQKKEDKRQEEILKIQKEFEELRVKTKKEKSYEAIQIAILFTERFGSFSNHSDFANIEDLRLFMSDDMNSWADDFIQKQKQREKDNSKSDYYGIITKVINSKIIKFENNIVHVLLTTQRQEIKGAVDDPEIYYQDILLNLEKESGDWKVGSANWKDKK